MWSHILPTLVVRWNKRFEQFPNMRVPPIFPINSDKKGLPKYIGLNNFLTCGSQQFATSTAIKKVNQNISYYTSTLGKVDLNINTW